MHSQDDANPFPEKKARWKKCPICWDTVYISETRPLRWYVGQENAPPREGEDIVLRLVMRQPGSTLALPRDGADVPSRVEDIPWYFAAEVTDYARIMKGTEDYMTEQFDAEIEDLHLQENEDELMFGEEPEWTRKAANAVREAKEKIRGIGDPPVAKKPLEKNPKRQPIQFTTIEEDVPEMYLVQHAAKSGVQNASSNPSEAQLDNSTSSQISCQTHQNAHHPVLPYFFYQALLHYYLAPLDIRILKSAFGNFASFPSTLLPRVERVYGQTMDDDLRKKTKYLSHLPHGCEVGFLECNWTDVVSPEILLQFKGDIEKRRKKNRDKDIEDEKARVRAERAQDDEHWASVRKRQPGIPSGSFSDHDFQPLTASLDAANASPPWPTRHGSSFASLASPSTSPSAPKTVWGTTRVAPTQPELNAQPEDDGGDGWLHSWEAELRAENELIAQAQAMSLEEGGDVRPPAASGQGKKKKAKKITLMSTTARRAA